MKVLVLLGGNPPPLDLLLRYIEKSDFIIAADSGAKILFDENIDVDLMLGDFDSLDEKYKNLIFTSKIKSYKKEKDFTDGYAAMQEAIKLKPDEIFLLGATGTRIDHFLANLNLLKLALNSEIKATLIDDHNECYLINKPSVIKKTKGYISFSAFVEDVSDFTINNLKYKLENHTLEFGGTLTVSNEFLDGDASVTFNRGTVLVMHTRD